MCMLLIPDEPDIADQTEPGAISRTVHKLLKDHIYLHDKSESCHLQGTSLALRKVM